MRFRKWLENKTIPCGDCFRFANNLAKEMLEDDIIPEDQIFVCHGNIQEYNMRDPKRFPHAWVEARGRAYDWQLRMAGRGSLPIKDFYELFKPSDVIKYSPVEAMKMQLRNRHHGPWD